MDLLKKNIHTERIKSKAVMQIPLEADINISDTKPDVANVIFSSAKIKVDEIKTGMNKIWVKGRLCYQLLYQADGDSGTLAGMDGDIPFMEEIYLDKLEGQDRVICRTNLEDLRVHIINSRKLSIQSVITLEPKVEESISEELCVDLDNVGSAEYGEKLEYRKKSLEFLETAVRKRDLLRIHEETRIPVGMPDIGVVLWKSAEAGSISFRPMDEKLGVTGELNVFVVYREDSTDKINWYETIIPFSETVECQNSREGMIADVSCETGHEEITIREDSDGELRIIGIETTIELEIKLFEKENTSIVADVYGVSCEVHAGIAAKQLKDLYMELNTVFKEDQMRLIGEVALQILYASNTGSSGLYPVKDTVPFEVVIELPGIQNIRIEQCSPSVQVLQQTVSIKDSAQLEWRGSVNVKMLIYNEKDEDILTELEIAPINAEVLEKLPGFAIYYVKPGDSLWQIGKKYYVSVERIKEMNNLTTDEIQAGDKILIVK